MATILKHRQVKRQKNYILPAKLKIAETIIEELKNGHIAEYRKFMFLQQAIVQNPYKAKYHKEYAFLLYKQYLKIKDNKAINDRYKKQLDNEALRHYDIYKSINMVNVAFTKKHLRHDTLLYINTVKNHIGQFDVNTTTGEIEDYYEYKINDNLHSFAKNPETSTRMNVVFSQTPSKEARRSRWGGMKSMHGTSLKPKKFGVLIPFIFASLLQMLTPKQSAAAEKPEIVLVDNATQHYYDENPVIAGYETPLLQELKQQSNINNNRHCEGIDRGKLSQVGSSIKQITSPAVFRNRSGTYRNNAFAKNNNAKNTANTPYSLAMLFLLLPFMGALARGSPLNLNPTAFKNLLGFMLLTASLGLNAQITTQADFGIQRIPDHNWMDSAKVTITMVDDTSIHQTEYTVGGDVHFDNVILDTIVTNTNQILENYTPNAEVIGSGRDHTFNFETTNQPQIATIYNIKGQIITKIQPQWDGINTASAYWNGNLPNGAKAPNGVYIFTAKGISLKFIHQNEGLSIGDQGINREFEEKNTETVSKYYAVLVEPASHNWQEQFQTFRDTVLMQDSSLNQFIKHVNAVPQFQDIIFHLARTYDINEPIAGATFNIKSKDSDTIIGTGVTDTNGNVWIENLPVGQAYDTVLVEFGGLPGYWSKKNCPLARPTVFYFQKDSISYDTTWTTLADTGLIVPQRPGDPSPATVTPNQVRPVHRAPWEIFHSLDGSTIEIEQRIQGPPEYINIEEAMGRPTLIYVEFTGVLRDQFFELLAKGDSLFYGTEPSNWQIVYTQFSPNYWDSIRPYYDYETNYSYDLGFNILNGNNNGDGDNTSTTGSLPPVGDPNVFTWAGEISLSLNENAFYKEMYGRRFDAGEVTLPGVGGEYSYMNPNASAPTLVDRAVFLLKRMEDRNKYRFKKSTWGASYTAPSDLSIEYSDIQ